MQTHFFFFVAFHQNTFCEFMFAEMLQFEIFITIPIWFQYQGQCVCVYLCYYCCFLL